MQTISAADKQQNLGVGTEYLAAESLATIEQGNCNRAAAVLWVITDQLPFPPRNGITLPLFHYISLLQQRRSVRIILLCNVDSPPSPEALVQNEQRFGKIQQIQLRRCGRVKRLVAELTTKEMYQHGWQLAQPLSCESMSVDDVALVSPMSAVAKWHAVKTEVPVPFAQCIAAVNDCTAAEYFYRGQLQVSRWREQVKGWVDRQRSRNIARIEAALLMPYDHVLLQTPADRDLMATLVSRTIADKVKVLPNGVSDTYLQLARAPGHQIVFVGELSGEYAATAHWLVSKVWPRVVSAHPDMGLLLVGRGADIKLRLLIQQTPGVQYIEYVKDLGDVYARARVVLSPVFKGYGLINKTLEAMACGIPVVGGTAAFNGIFGFQNGVHGVTCTGRSTAEFVEALENLLGDPALQNKMGIKARELIRGQFCWKSAAAHINELLVR